jgi:muramidase (phage lysozyme)
MDKTVPTGAAMLLDFIGGIEAPRGYDTIFGNNQNKLAVPLTSMALDDVIAAQKSWSKRFGSSASGRYQFMQATLQGLKSELGLLGSQKFDANLQDRLGYHLLRRRGYDDYVAGKIPRVEFGKRIAQEWASMPVLADMQGAHRPLKRGQSYYAGDALNKSLVSPEKLETVLALVKKAPDPVAAPPAPVPPSPAPKPAPVTSPPVGVPVATPKVSVWAALFGLLMKLVGK